MFASCIIHICLLITIRGNFEAPYCLYFSVTDCSFCLVCSFLHMQIGFLVSDYSNVAATGSRFSVACSFVGIHINFSSLLWLLEYDYINKEL